LRGGAKYKFYLFMDLDPTILMITGRVMWWYRKKASYLVKTESCGENKVYNFNENAKEILDVY
jgi:uncharacterized iron-regulated membrane protein